MIKSDQKLIKKMSIIFKQFDEGARKTIISIDRFSKALKDFDKLFEELKYK